MPIPGHGRNKLNAAYAIGGAPLLTETADYLAVAVRECLLTDPDPSAVLAYSEVVADTEVLQRALDELGDGRHPAVAMGGTGPGRRRAADRPPWRGQHTDRRRRVGGGRLSDRVARQLNRSAEPGLHTLHVRATDSTGEVQPEERRDPVPSGATGWHNRTFRVVAA